MANIIYSERSGVCRISSGDKVLASMGCKFYGDAVVNLSKWKAKVKGGGYGRLLMDKMFEEHPHIHLINTDGFTEAGRANFEKVLGKHDFKLVDWRYTANIGYGRAMRQDVIDYYVESQEKGKRSFFYVDPQLHSREANE